MGPGTHIANCGQLRDPSRASQFEAKPRGPDAPEYDQQGDLNVTETDLDRSVETPRQDEKIRAMREMIGKMEIE